jgi:hypothetical protein
VLRGKGAGQQGLAADTSQLGRSGPGSLLAFDPRGFGEAGQCWLAQPKPDPAEMNLTERDYRDFLEAARSHASLTLPGAQVEAAFVSFSLVVGARRPQSLSSTEIRQLYSMRDVAVIGLAAVAGSFLPLAIRAFGVDSEVTWRLASAFILALGGLGLGSSLWRGRRFMWDEVRTEPIQTAVVAALNVAAFGLILTNIIAGGPASGARYVAAVLLTLAVAGLLFVSATFSHPGE